MAFDGLLLGLCRDSQTLQPIPQPEDGSGAKHHTDYQPQDAVVLPNGYFLRPHVAGMFDVTVHKRPGYQDLTKQVYIQELNPTCVYFDMDAV